MRIRRSKEGHTSYDNAGNLTSQVRTGSNAETDSYTWDLRGRMATATVNGTTTTYTYDTDGVRTSEGTPGGQTTYYLNDPNNPTGYTKAVEELSSVDGRPQDAVPHRSYVLGLQVIGQADGSPGGPLFLLQDGHGNTRALVDTNAATVEQYNFDAFGDLLASAGAQSSAANALTPWLQGDGLYDPASGWNYNLARWRDGFRFTSMDDPGLFRPGDLANANLYLYAQSNPIIHADPSGHGGGIAGLLVAAGITLLFMSATNLNAPTVGGPIYHNNQGDAVLDIPVAVVVGGYWTQFFRPLLEEAGLVAVSAPLTAFADSGAGVQDLPLEYRTSMQLNYQSDYTLLQNQGFIRQNGPLEAAYDKMAGITAGYNIEVGLVRSGEDLYLIPGVSDAIDLSGFDEALAHTHPSGDLRFSPEDLESFARDYPSQTTHVLIAPDGTFKSLPIPQR